MNQILEGIKKNENINSNLVANSNNLIDAKDKEFQIISEIHDDYLKIVGLALTKVENPFKMITAKEIAEDFLSRLMYQKQNPVFIENNGIPLIELMMMNVKEKREKNAIQGSQNKRELETIKKISECYLANKKIDEINSDEIQEYLNSMTHLSNSYIRKIKQELSQAFRLAIKKKYITTNPINDVVLPKSDRKDREVDPLSIEEERVLANYLFQADIKQSPYKNAFLIQMYTGMRIGEVLALQTSDFDLIHKKIRINKTVHQNEFDKPVLGESTKTKSGERIVNLPDNIYNFIVEQIKFAKTQPNNKLGLIFVSKTNECCDPRTANKSLKRIGQTIGIDNLATHRLRHTFATRCIESGMSPVVVQKLLGHKDVSITLNTYTGVLTEFENNEINKVNNYYMNQNLLGPNLNENPNEIKKLNENNPIVLDSTEVINNEPNISKDILDLLQDEDILSMLKFMAKEKKKKDDNIAKEEFEK